MYPNNFQVCVQSVKLFKVIFVDDGSTRFEPPAIRLPGLHPAGDT